MKFPSTTSLLALAASTAVSAQSDDIQSGPFALKIVNATDASLNDRYLYACHAGAAIEGLCLGTNSTTTSASSTYYLNTSAPCDGCTAATEGAVVWNLPVQLPDGSDYLSEPLSIALANLGSNVIFPLFEPGYATTSVLGFTNGTDGTDDGRKLYASVWGDDSLSVPGQQPEAVARRLQNWHVCWGVVGGYYYQALAWVTSGAPHNPTCQKVDVVREDL